MNFSWIKSISLIPDGGSRRHSHGPRILRRCLIALAWVLLLTLGDVLLQRFNRQSRELYGWLYLAPANAVCLILWFTLVFKISRHWRGFRISKPRAGALLLVLLTGVLWASFLGADLASFFAKPVTASTPSSPASDREE